MTRDEFLHKYHNYQTPYADEAIKEAEKVNNVGIENELAVAVMFPSLGYCLMLNSAVEELKNMGLPIEVKL